MTCKDCEKHNECEKKGKLLFYIDDICELVYQPAADKTCSEFKRGDTQCVGNINC